MKKINLSDIYVDDLTREEIYTIILNLKIFYNDLEDELVSGTMRKTDMWKWKMLRRMGYETAITEGKDYSEFEENVNK